MAGLEDQVVQYQAAIEERQAFINSLIDAANGRDLNESEMKMVNDATDKMRVFNGMIAPLREALRVGQEARERFAEVQAQTVVARNPKAGVAPFEYRSAGQYVVDHWQSAIGVPEARERMNVYMRAAAHQTTSDNLGVVPDPVVGGLLNFVDTQRPIVSALGPLPVPGGRFHRPKVTQHTQVDLQSAEKGELVSQKMLITRVDVAMSTYGGYVNVSKQDIDFSAPQIMDLVINDLAGMYAIKTESVTAAALLAGATAQTPVITVASTAAEVTAAVWKAIGSVYTATGGAGRSFIAAAPDMMAAFGQAFTPLTYPPINNQASSGFTAAAFGQGAQGYISGVPVYMSAGLAAGKALLVNTASAEVYEQRVGSLQVTEPSVLGVQVAYAGYFTAVVLVATGVIKLTA